MTPIINEIAALRRPKLLIRAARIAARDYCRTRDLPGQGARSGIAMLNWLLAQEAALNDARQARDAAYSAAEHVRLLAALLAESRRQTMSVVPT
ncbi:DUF6477 family protein [Abyssibius alkaniclasticus]|uniref:DUF6477 family protein n=1 Tax=Abyssibius alkaniclasticus TaxID=2881234 RepID=UPI002363ED44|nr:DUF6477 family protein [Abyssibius alkaniclasticus]UPH69863.1 DUF6477 family protein [Abyssibius alkaniclasticus]|tara:strand:+ start:427 stop:708 length:282 start_codon:yes stop_codon:yes gene_type:complete